jgi:HlyD family secretion protein
MDIARPERARALRRRRLMWAIGGVAALALASLALARLEPAPPSVESGTLWIDTVKRGEMLRQVRGPGVLVPEREQWVSAASEGQVERVLLRPGVRVEPDTVILHLLNPELAQQAFEAESELLGAEADLRVLQAQLASQLLNAEAEAAGLAAQLAEARLQVEANERLHEEGLLPDLTFKLSKLRADELVERQKLEQQRLARLRESNDAQVAARSSRLDQQRALQRLRQGQVRALAVVAGISGILQEVPVDPGQRVTPGTVLARVAQPETLKAELRIPETQAKDVTVGQTAAIDTRNGVVAGRVTRIDPAARQGTVLVDVALTGELPAGARPDLSVDGTIEIERLPDALFVGRPAFGQPGESVGLFRLAPDGKTAVRVTVELGRASTHTVEVVRGLDEGDRVVLSDTSAWDGFEKIRLR